MTVLGNLALWVALLLGVWAALVGFLGGSRGRADLQRSARHAVFAMCGALLIAVYAGQKGSLLFWATVLSVFGSLAQLFTARRHQVYLPYVASVVGTVTAFFV